MFTKTNIKSALLAVGIVIALASFDQTRPYVNNGIRG